MEAMNGAAIHREVQSQPLEIRRSVDYSLLIFNRARHNLRCFYDLWHLAGIRFLSYVLMRNLICVLS
jgi:hypothetical protein